MREYIRTKSKSTVKNLNRKRIRSKANLIKVKKKYETYKENLKNDENGQDYAVNKVINRVKNTSKKLLNESRKIGSKSVDKTLNKMKSYRESGENKENKENRENKENNNYRNAKKIKKYKKVDIKNDIKNDLSTKIEKSKENARKNYVIRNILQQTKKINKSIVKSVKEIIEKLMKVIKVVVSYLNLFIAIIFVSVTAILITIFMSGASTILNDDFEINEEWDNDSFITNNLFVVIAQGQVGNVGGEIYWKWYGFDERVSWCACFVSWCADQCGLIENGVVPRYSACNDGINWYKSNNRWVERDGYSPKTRRYYIF